MSYVKVIMTMCTNKRVKRRLFQILLLVGVVHMILYWVMYNSQYKSPWTKIRAWSHDLQPVESTHTTMSGITSQFSSNNDTTWMVPQVANLQIVASKNDTTWMVQQVANIRIVADQHRIRYSSIMIAEPYIIPTANLPIVAEYIENLPTHSDAESLYPSTNHPWDTRVFKQLTYVPKHITGIKKIFVHSVGFTKNITLNSVQRFKDWRCHVDQCTIMTHYTANESDILDADIILVEQTKWRKPSAMVLNVFRKKRKPNQIWALVTGETKALTADPFKGHTYNWTVSTAPSSPIHVNFGSAFQILPNASTLPQARNWAAGKHNLVIGIVSNCRPNNARDKYYKKLAKYIHVDIFGKCGKVLPSCYKKHWHTQCARKMIPAYKFYLAFENHNCDTWVTEKPFINALRNDVIPIVMGPPRTYARHILPTNSYIHVEDFKSAKDLAEYLNKVANNDTLYNSYFQWKGAWAIREHDDEIFGDFDDIPPYNAFCRVCAMLHAPPRKMVTTLEEWKRVQTCRKPNNPGP